MGQFQSQGWALNFEEILGDFLGDLKLGEIGSQKAPKAPQAGPWVLAWVVRSLIFGQSGKFVDRTRIHGYRIPPA